MISLSSAVTIITYLVVGGLVFGLLWYLVSFCEKKFPSGAPFWPFAYVVLVLLAVLVLIGALLSVVNQQPLFRP